MGDTATLEIGGITNASLHESTHFPLTDAHCGDGVGVQTVRIAS